MKAEATVKTWEKTRLQNLVRHKSGRYYARLFRNGKEVWKSLKTDHFSVAESRLAEVQKEHRKLKKTASSASSAKMTFQQAADEHFKRLEAKVSIKRSTRKYWGQILAAVKKSWPELAETEVRRITSASIRDWAARYAKSTSPTRYNNGIALVRHVIDVAIESGAIYTNPAEDLERKPVKAKTLELPTLAQFSAFISAIREAYGRFSDSCGDLAEGLAFTGCRLSEAARIELRDVNFAAGEVLIKGDPEDGTKNGEIRRVPLIPPARALFERIMAKRSDAPKTAPAFKVRECQKAMDGAAKKVGMARITHHDLRHFFATVCIESGVDIPTVSRWLGHKDGGVLALKTYGHLRREHSLAQAQKVTFTAA